MKKSLAFFTLGLFVIVCSQTLLAAPAAPASKASTITVTNNTPYDLVAVFSGKGGNCHRSFSSGVGDRLSNVCTTVALQPGQTRSYTFAASITGRAVAPAIDKVALSMYKGDNDISKVLGKSALLAKSGSLLTDNDNTCEFSSQSDLSVKWSKIEITDASGTSSYQVACN
jgi:hypothetical protein